ncbi:LuxR C-terminal-related transcriptional regulator [Kutzneria buriramensis]|uniref:Putative ATPase n=1 Tax=Kutzneria buriramensis TaxID=1045776 RepID=A0A3E0HHQ2_9PSEU|nr:LuxR C-terminal-related transcriptional regulator [Kutzneria buriramensis]REH45912.1 putative ATPase [Kutzneria buriramensis]
MARPARRPGNLPADATSFVGRRRELAEVRQKLAKARLVSLVGPGGVGKTRLALRAGTELARGFPDGTWLVELADLRDPGLVANAVLAGLDLRDQAAEPAELVLSYLRDKRLLLVVDNCEHLLAATAALLSRILHTAPGVCVVVTSREPLSVAGEHVVTVPPLDLPLAQASLVQVRQNEAVQLFVERATAIGRFELTAANASAVVELCRRLDGLPLAIELAAVRTRVLSVAQILPRLADRFALLTGGQAVAPRHHTLRATIDWSHDLLTADEQALLRRLCVFGGRFTVDDVESVCAQDLPAAGVLDAVASLVDKSLLIRDDVGEVACYRLHETMREYAGIKLREAGEQESFERRCAEYYRDRCLESLPQVRFRLLEWLAWMDVEIDNIRSVLGQCVLRGDRRLGLDLAAAAGWFWATRATSEGVRWLDELDAGEHLLAQFMRGFLAVLQADADTAGPLLRRAAAAAERAGLVPVQVHALTLAAIVAHTAGEDGHDLLEAAAGLAPNDHLSTISVRQAESIIGLFDGDLATVRTAAADGIRRCRAVDDLYALEMMLANLALATPDFDEARPLLAEALHIARRLDDRVAQHHVLGALACHAAATQQQRLAAQLLGATESLRAGTTLRPYLTPALDTARAATRAALGDTTYQACLEDGRRLSRADAIALALGEPAPAAATSTAAGPLTPREAEVAHLVAEGLSNRQIATRLHISDHTVDSHIRRILVKLGCTSRTQVATWITDAGRSGSSPEPAR